MNEISYKNNRKIITFIIILLIIIIGIVITVIIHNLNKQNNINSSSKNGFNEFGMLSLDNYTVEFNIPTDVETTSIQQEKWRTYTSFIKNKSRMRIYVAIEKIENGNNAKEYLENQKYDNDAYPNNLEIKTTMLNQKEIQYLDFEYEQLLQYSSSISKFHYICAAQDIGNGYVYVVSTRVLNPNEQISISNIKEFLNFRIK